MLNNLAIVKIYCIFVLRPEAATVQRRPTILELGTRRPGSHCSSAERDPPVWEHQALAWRPQPKDSPGPQQASSLEEASSLYVDQGAQEDRRVNRHGGGPALVISR